MVVISLSDRICFSVLCSVVGELSAVHLCESFQQKFLLFTSCKTTTVSKVDDFVLCLLPGIRPCCLYIGVLTTKRVQGVLTNILYDSHARFSGNERYGPRYGE